jgi:hypothetical protein
MAPKLGDRPNVMIEQGGIAKAAFNAIDGMINSMTKTTVFSHCKPSACSGIATDL